MDNCLGHSCRFFDQCFVLEARRQAQRAQVVIVNHHLLLADLALKEAGFGDLLPGAESVIVDEAHQLPEIAQQFFGVAAGTRELELLARDVAAEARLAALDSELVQDLAVTAEQLLREVARLRRLAADTERGRIPWASSPPALRDALPDCRQALDALGERLQSCEDASAPA